MPGSGRPLPWQLASGELSPPTAFKIQGDVLGMITLAREGAGLIQIYDFAVARELARGELVEVLAGERGASRPFSLREIRAACPSRRRSRSSSPSWSRRRRPS
jgi:DNA-binding transcriptional LysR family regulator